MCGSLEKVVKTSLTKYINRLKKFGSTYVLTPKLDGVSLHIYITPALITCITRGDLNMGHDVTQKCATIIQRYQHLQQYVADNSLDMLAIRGELILPILSDIGPAEDRRAYIAGQVSNNQPFLLDFVPYEVL